MDTQPRGRTISSWRPWKFTTSGLAAAWLLGAGLQLALTGGSHPLATAVSSLTGFTVSVAVVVWAVRRRWQAPAKRLAEQVHALAFDPGRGGEFRSTPELEELARALDAVSLVMCSTSPSSSNLSLPGDSVAGGPSIPMTRSGVFEPPSGWTFDTPDPMRSGEFSTADMVDRLDPRVFRWLDSSPAEQQFLGWPLDELRHKSFLEIVHPDDVSRVRDGFRTALSKGEVNGLLFRIRTAPGKSRAVVMNVGARYGADRGVSHLRGHLTDVTAKVRAEKERRLRNRELTVVNEQLRLINRELEELKERYRDLYEKSPAMYFSLDASGRIQECNDTLLNTLGYRREALLGRSYELILPPERRALFPGVLADFLRQGTIENESRWVKADGETIDVWIKASAVRGPDGRFTHSRSVAQDITARHRLESELQEKHERLKRTNEELSRRNREMDEFTHVVSHDLQEPLRTLDAFSEFLRREYGGGLDEKGQEYVRYVVEASRRMRELVRDLLTLSRAGKVTGVLGPVDLGEQLRVVCADLAGLIGAKKAVVRAEGALPRVWGDRYRVAQLLSNLVANGLKYNESAVPTVVVGEAADRAAGTGLVTLYVRDNGIGIEARHHKKIFQLFRRLHGRDEYGGTGAGLAICEKIVHAHGGTIWVESDPGRGSTFYFTFRTTPNPAAGDGELS